MRGTEVQESQKAKAPRLITMLRSPVGRKLLTGVTGVFLVVFIIEHMVGNLRYFSGNAAAYDEYAHFLLGLGPLLWFIEIVLLVCFVLHAYLGVSIYVEKKRARGQDYALYKTAGKPSLQTVSSRTMIWTGLVLAVFLVIHLLSFKFGPGMDEGFVREVNGVRIRDFKTLMEIKFNEPLYAFAYPLVMILLGFHLRHGVWSAFQSLGAMNPRLTPVVYGIGTVLAVLLAVGFLVLPLYIYFFVPAPPIPDPGIGP